MLESLLWLSRLIQLLHVIYCSFSSLIPAYTHNYIHIHIHIHIIRHIPNILHHVQTSHIRKNLPLSRYCALGTSLSRSEGSAVFVFSSTVAIASPIDVQFTSIYNEVITIDSVAIGSTGTVVPSTSQFQQPTPQSTFFLCFFSLFSLSRSLSLSSLSLSSLYSRFVQ